jgi:hypothetical protein
MAKLQSIAGASIAAVLVASGALAPASTVNNYVPPAPGTIAQNLVVTFNGRANDFWHAVASRKLVGGSGSQGFYQWYLSIYALRRGAYRLRYQSPGNGGPLARVEQANGAKMWFPVQDLRLVGAAVLMRPRVQQLVVQSHERAADCGSATVTVFATGSAGNPVPAVSVENPCDLSAAIASDSRSVELTGPYYAANAPRCCPTKPRVTATLRYNDHKWSLTPNYFKLGSEAAQP